MTQILLAPTHRTDAELSQLYARLPEWRQTHVDALSRPQDRADAIVAGTLLAVAWQSQTSAPLPAPMIQPHGKPEWPGSGLHLSLSHRDGWAACAVSAAPVGVDLHGPIVATGLLERVLSPTEAHLASSLRHDLAPLWTRKEALGKLSGEGIGTDLTSIDGLDSRLCTWRHDRLSLTLSVATTTPQPAASIKLLLWTGDAVVPATGWQEWRL